MPKEDLKMANLTAEAKKKWILENCVNEAGNIDLDGLDFSDFNGNIFISNMKVKNNLCQDGQEVNGFLYQNCQIVNGDLYQDSQEVQGSLHQNRQTVNGNLWQERQIVKGDLS